MENKKIINTKLVKETNNDEMTFTSIVLKADYRDDDGENQDFWPKEVVKQAAYDFMINCQQGNLSHVFDTDLVKVAASYPAPCDFPMGGGEVKEGDWVMTLKIMDRELWESEFKAGNFNGYSVGVPAIVEVEED
jgi:hypothetical protein